MQIVACLLLALLARGEDVVDRRYLFCVRGFVVTSCLIVDHAHGLVSCLLVCYRVKTVYGAAYAYGLARGLPLVYGYCCLHLLLQPADGERRVLLVGNQERAQIVGYHGAVDELQTVIFGLVLCGVNLEQLLGKGVVDMLQDRMVLAQKLVYGRGCYEACGRDGVVDALGGSMEDQSEGAVVELGLLIVVILMNVRKVVIIERELTGEVAVYGCWRQVADGLQLFHDLGRLLYACVAREARCGVACAQADVPYVNSALHHELRHETALLAWGARVLYRR